MAAYKNIGTYPVDLPGGRQLAPGEVSELGDISEDVVLSDLAKYGPLLQTEMVLDEHIEAQKAQDEAQAAVQAAQEPAPVETAPVEQTDEEKSASKAGDNGKGKGTSE